MCAFATCPQPNAASPSHATRRERRSARTYPAAPARTTVLQAIAPANGIEIPTDEAASAIAIDAPAHVAAIRPSRSIRRNAYIPRPARSGFHRIAARIAAPGESVENSSIGGR